MTLSQPAFEKERVLVGSDYRSRSVWHGAAFVVEALLLLLFLIVSLAIFFSLFSGADEMARENDQLSKAVEIATNAAEEFAANPLAASGTSDVGDYQVNCSVTPESREAGTLYRATITVVNDDTPVYSLETSVYESGGSA